MKLKDIKPNKANPRTIKDDKFRKLLNSIQEFPKMMELRPMVIDADGTVLGGNMRLKALQELGYTEIPDTWVRRAADLTDEEKQRFIIADNVGFGEWDWEALANDWDVVDLEAWGLEIPQFDNEAEELEAIEDDYDVPEGGIETDIVIGDLFEIGEHRLLCGDSTDSDAVARLMNGEKADMVFTDPPYGINAIKSSGVLSSRYEQYQNEENDKTALDFINMCIANNDKIICWGGNYFAHNLPKSTHWIIWDKRGAEMKGGNENGDQSDCEIAWTNLKKKNVKIYKHVWAGWFRQGSKELELSTKIHPSQKPVGLFINIFNDYDFYSCFDGFLGSGSTMVAAHQLKRRCFGMELEPKYCQVIIDRMAKLDPSLKITRNGKEYKTAQ